jgi:hypothetical protein
MFRLLKLVAYGLLGYAIYEFVRGAFGGEIEQMAGRLQDQMQGGQGGGGFQGRESSGRQRNAARTNMTGPGEGQMQDTQDTDGGSVRHAVGRGVVS